MKNTPSRAEHFRTLLAEPQPAQWRALSEKDVGELQDWHNKQVGDYKTIASLIWAVVALPAGYWAWTNEPFALLGLGVGSFIWFILSCLFIGIEASPGYLLTPLKQDPENCKSAMNLLTNTNVVAYRDAVVAQGRELRIADLRCMRAIFNDLDADRTCRILHGLAPASDHPSEQGA